MDNDLDFNLNTLKTFYVVATSKSVIEASKKLYISQPAVSKSIKNLEELLGVKLFFRNSEGIELTNEGTKLFKYVEKSFYNVRAGMKLLDSEKYLESGKIIIGIPSHIASVFLMERLEKMRKDYPNLSIEIISSSTKELMKSLEEHKLDFVIDSSPLDNVYPDMKVEKLTSMETCFISKDKIKIKDVSDIESLKLILPISKSSVRRRLEQSLDPFNVKLKPMIEVETTELIIKSVKRNLGVGYVMKRSAEKDLKSGDINLVDFPQELPSIDINLVYVESCLTYPARKIIDSYIRGV